MRVVCVEDGFVLHRAPKGRMKKVSVYRARLIDRSCYSGKKLRDIRKSVGVGRPPDVG